MAARPILSGYVSFLGRHSTLSTRFGHRALQAGLLAFLQHFLPLCCFIEVQCTWPDLGWGDEAQLLAQPPDGRAESCTAYQYNVVIRCIPCLLATYMLVVQRLAPATVFCFWSGYVCTRSPCPATPAPGTIAAKHGTEQYLAARALVAELPLLCKVTSRLHDLLKAPKPSQRKRRSRHASG